MVLTLAYSTKSDNRDSALLPQLYWCAVGLLSTPLETKFIQIIDLLECLLDKMDLSNPYTVDMLSANKLSDFSNTSSVLQPLPLVSRHSGKTSNHVIKVLQPLSNIQHFILFDSSSNRLRDMYTLILPWCLRANGNNKIERSIIDFVCNITNFAETEKRTSIAQIMTSFAKSRFRAKDDFMHQAAATLRKHYAPDS